MSENEIVFGPQHSKGYQKRSSTLFKTAFLGHDKSKQLCAFSSREHWVWSNWSNRAWTCWRHDWEAWLKKDEERVDFHRIPGSSGILKISWYLEAWSFIDDSLTICWGSSKSRPGPSELLGTDPSAQGETRPATVWTLSDSFSTQTYRKIKMVKREDIIKYTRVVCEPNWTDSKDTQRHAKTCNVMQRSERPTVLALAACCHSESPNHFVADLCPLCKTHWRSTTQLSSWPGDNFQSKQTQVRPMST